MWTGRRKRGFQVAGVALLMASGLLAWNKYETDRIDPMCDGWRLSERLQSAAWPPDPFFSKAQNEQAIRKAGTNAIPLLLKYISTDYSTPYWVLNNRLSKYAPRLFSNSTWLKDMGTAGFEILGPLGQPAVPVLLKLMEQDRTRDLAAQALGSTRDPQALALMCTLITHADKSERQTGLLGLDAMKEDGASVLEQLMKIGKEDTDVNTRGYAIMAIGNIGTADPTVPYLIDILQNDTNDYAKRIAAMALGNFPSQAQVTRPVLTNAQQNPSQLVAIGARIGLQSLDRWEHMANLKGPENRAVQELVKKMK